MFKFVEKKGFFYTCIIISIIITGSLFFNYKQSSLVLLCTNILLLFPLLGLLFFSNKNNKELMKVLLTSLIVCTILSFVQKFYHVIFWMPIWSHNNQLDIIRLNYSLALLTAALICVCTIFVNHCIMNYSNMPSKIAINLNMILVILLIIIAIAEKFGWFFFKSANQFATNRPFNDTIKYIDTSFLALAIVSAEAFINQKRAERATNAPAKKEDNKSKKK